MRDLRRVAHDPVRNLLDLPRLRLDLGLFMRRVILESPYAGDIYLNLAYARLCVRDSLSRGESPLASHIYLTQPGILDDGDPAERKLGINAGLAWREVADACVVYTDRGISEGMKYGIAAANGAGLPVEYRSIYTG